jgi:hypothetical protein
MSASKPRKEVNMTKARMIYLIALLSLLVFYFEGYLRAFRVLATFGGGSWHDGS